MVVKDSRLGPRRADVTHWRCRRFEDEDDRKGKPLYWGEGDGIEVPEWPIKSCSPETISERWGPGRYVVDYMHLDVHGRRRSRGPSRVLHITTPKGRSESSPPPEPPSGGPENANGSGSATPNINTADPNFSSVFSLLAFLEDRNEKARTTASAEARYSIMRAEADTKAAQERALAEVKAAQERYRTDMEFQLERERLASKERIAQIEAQARAPARGVRVDVEELAKRIEAVGERVDEALERIEDGPTPASGPDPADNTAALVTALKDTLAPIISLVVGKLATGPALPDAALPPLAGKGGDGSDPKGEPN
jgi:hypothetical protein